MKIFNTSCLFIIFSLLSCSKDKDPNTNPTNNPSPGSTNKNFVVDQNYRQNSTNLNDRSLWAGASTLDGKVILLLGGEEIYLDDELMRLNVDGTKDVSFNPYQFKYSTSGRRVSFKNIAIQGDGKMLLAGSFPGQTEDLKYRLIRLNADGSVDEGFKLISIEGRGSISDIYLQADGKIIIGGDFEYNPHKPPFQTLRQLIRLNPDGSFDDSFSFVFPSFLGHVGQIVGLPGENLLLVGEFYLGEGKLSLMKINKDGVLDQTFKEPDLEQHEGLGYDLRTAASTHDGKILIGGNFQGEGIKNLVRLNSDGSLDKSFQTDKNQNAEAHFPMTIYPLANGKFLVGRDASKAQTLGTEFALALFDPSGKDEGFHLNYNTTGIDQILPVGSNNFVLFSGFRETKTADFFQLLKVKVE